MDLPKRTFPPPTRRFTLFSALAPELRAQVWALACLPRNVEVRYNVEQDRCLSSTAPPALLSVSREARYEALRVYGLSFGTHTSEARTYFNPYRDTLYLPRHRQMGYDDSLRDFRSFLDLPQVLDEVRWLGIDHVDIEVKRPWEFYNKASLIRGFPRLERIILVVKNEAEQNLCSDGNFEFVEPGINPEDMLRMWVEFKQSFAREEQTLEDVSLDLSKDYSRYILPTIRILSRKAAERISEDAGQMQMLARRMMAM